MFSKIPHSFAHDGRLGTRFKDGGQVGGLHPSCRPGDVRHSEASVLLCAG